MHASMHALWYLSNELEYTADFEACRCLRSASSLSLNVRRTRLSTVGDQAFRVASASTCHVHTSLFRTVLQGRLETFLFRR